MKAIRVLGAAAFLLLPLTPAFAQSADRFPRPEFQKAYKEPKLQKPQPRSAFMEYFDVVVLVAMLSAATYYSLKVVSRKAIFILSVVAVLYFGFYREGCVCPIGSIQNVAQGLGSTG